MADLAKCLLALGFLWPGDNVPVQQHAPSEWLTFRYDSERVLFYFCDSKVASNVTQPDRAYDDPSALWGRGGYLTKPSPDVLTEESCRDALSKVRVGEPVKLRIDAVHSVSAIVQMYVEQWGSESPNVRIVVIARIEGKTGLCFAA